MKRHILILGGFGFSAAGTAVGMVADLGLANGQQLFVASIVGALLGNLLGWYLFKQKGELGEKMPKRKIDKTL